MAPESPVPERYYREEVAAAYEGKFRVSPVRRLSNRRELEVVRQAVRQAGTGGRMLDCPCGAGRLVPTLLGLAEHVTAIDASPAMVAEAQDALSGPRAEGRLDLAVSTADRLPFEDGAFDVAVCHRLLHHLKRPEDRAAVLHELRRVARRGVVLSFSDASTWKMRWLRVRGRAHRRVTWTLPEIQAEAGAAGLRLERPVRRVAGLFSLVAVAVFRPGIQA